MIFTLSDFDLLPEENYAHVCTSICCKKKVFDEDFFNSNIQKTRRLEFYSMKM